MWFGGNHGFAWGDANIERRPTCNGQLHCGVFEHVHPRSTRACTRTSAEDREQYPNDPSQWRVHGALLTDAYYGVGGGSERRRVVRRLGSLHPVPLRHQHRRHVENPDYFQAQVTTEGSS